MLHTIAGVMELRGDGLEMVFLGRGSALLGTIGVGCHLRPPDPPPPPPPHFSKFWWDKSPFPTDDVYGRGVLERSCFVLYEVRCIFRVVLVTTEVLVICCRFCVVYIGEDLVAFGWRNCPELEKCMRDVLGDSATRQTKPIHLADVVSIAGSRSVLQQVLHFSEHS